MKNLWYLLVRFGTPLLFVLLEFISFYLIINYNREQKDIFVNSTNLFATTINNRLDRFEAYLQLEIANDSLQLQNGKLLNLFINSGELNLAGELELNSVDNMQYSLIPTTICNTTYNLKNNYLTLCDGAAQGIQKDMGLISVNGIIGQVVDVSENFAVAMSLLHTQTRISSIIKGKNAIGNLRWPGDTPLEMSLEAIPKHIDAQVGDTVVTSGFSTIFPRGIPVGTISEIKKGTSEYEIKVRLFHDPTKWDVLYVVNNRQASEQRSLEESTME